MTKWLLAISTLMLVVFGYAAHETRERRAAAEIAHREASMALAHETYADNCAACHGAFGAGTEVYPALNSHAVRAMSYAELASVIRHGREGTAMVAFAPVLSDVQVGALVTLLQDGNWRDVQAHVEAVRAPDTRSVRNTTPVTDAPAEAIRAGAGIYAANCASCHLAGSAHAVGPVLETSPYVQETSDEALLAYIIWGQAAEDGDSGFAMPARGGNPNLTDDDLRQTIAYIRELAANPGFTLEAADEQTAATFDGVDYRWQLVADNLDRPVLVVDDGTGALYAAEQNGLVVRLDDALTPFLDLRDQVPPTVYEGTYTEQGLLGLAFHPDYAQNGQVFASYVNRDGDSVIARFSAVDGVVDPASEQAVLTVDQPFEDHNGGHIAFGPDGYLYAGFGDGGRVTEPNYFSQMPDTFLGKLLRIDVDSGDPYAVPDDNPFLDDPAFAPEIYATGLRNPWRFAFHDGAVIIGDVGQWRTEEINLSRGGENFGWSAFEGTEPYVEDETVRGGTLTEPILAYTHDAGLSVTGGVVAADGTYFYGDYVNGKIWAAREIDGAWTTELFMDTPFVIASFGQDAAGTVYLVDYKGAVYRLESSAAS